MSALSWALLDAVEASYIEYVPINLLDLFPSFSASELKCVFAYRNVLRHQVPWPLARSWSGGDCLGGAAGERVPCG